jgi:hypothetical protein
MAVRASRARERSGAPEIRGVAAMRAHPNVFALAPHDAGRERHLVGGLG